MDGLWLFLAIVIVAKSPIGRAIADRIAGRSSPALDHGELDALEQRVEDRILDLEERVEFAERLLQQKRASDGLPPIQ
jgi:hypothetical protein